MLKKLSESRVVVTGAAGFTGRVLVARLRSLGAEVHGLNRRSIDGERALDLMDKDAISGFISDIQPTHVFHLAGMSATHGVSVAQTYSLNILGTVNLLEALAARAKPDFVMIASSAAVYAPPSTEKPLDEHSLVKPTGHYGMSKLAVEQISQLYQDKLPILKVRPFNYTGIGQTEDFVIPKIVGHFARGEPLLRVGNMTVQRDIMDVDSVVDAYMKFAAMDIYNETVNVCSGRPVRLANLITHLSDISGRRIDIVVDPAFVRPGEPQLIVGSPEKLNSLIGPLHPPLLKNVVTRMYEAAGGKLI